MKLWAIQSGKLQVQVRGNYQIMVRKRLCVCVCVWGGGGYSMSTGPLEYNLATAPIFFCTALRLFRIRNNVSQFPQGSK